MDLITAEIGLYAKEIVRQAGTLLKDMQKEPLEMKEKKSHSDLVTIVDQKVEQFLVDKILEKYPEHGILGEEGTFVKDLSDCKVIWVIDPIDGTTNFIHNFPFYGISVAVVYEGIGIVGVVYNPSTDELFYAEKDKGAFVNDKQMRLNEPMSLSNALISTTMFWENPFKKDTLHPNVIELYKATRGMRMLGGAALSICEIASGKITAYIMPMLNAWDFAAGVIIAEEAGAVVTKLDGSPVDLDKGSSILVTHPDIHTEILNMPNWNFR